MSEPLGQISLPLTSSAGGSPAKISPAQERARALLVAAVDCGLSLPGLSESSPLHGLLSRTSRVALRAGLTRSRQGWSSSAMKRYRSLCRRKMSALTTPERESSSLPTLTTKGSLLCPSMQKWPSHRKLLKYLAEERKAASFGRRRSIQARQPQAADRCWWSTQPPVDAVVSRFPGRVDHQRALGNAVVPQCAEVIGWVVRELEASPSTPRAP